MPSMISALLGAGHTDVKLFYTQLVYTTVLYVREKLRNVVCTAWYRLTQIRSLSRVNCRMRVNV
jgi:hypothetical protein